MDNVILVTIDSLRADHVGWQGYERPTTPNFDCRAEEAHVFENSFAHAGATRPSFPSILASNYALMFGGPERLTDDQTTVAEVFDDAGYHTAGFHSNLYLSADFGYSRGFDHFFDAKSDPSTVAKLRQFVKQRVDSSGRLFGFLKSAFDATEKHAGVELGSAYVEAAELTDMALEWVADTDPSEPHFLWVHYMDVHHPYMPPAEHQRPFRDEPIGNRRATQLRRRMLEEPQTLSDEEHQALIDLYDAEIRYVDNEVQRLIEAVDKRWGNDVVEIVTADHGEEFRDHGSYSHGTLHDEGIHVPLYVYDDKQGDRYDEMVGLLDVAPTAIDYADASKPENWFGNSLRSLVADDEWDRDAIIGNWGDANSDDREYFFHDHEWKYICGREGERLYYLPDDDGEHSNVVDEYPEIRDDIRERIATHEKEIEQTHRDLGHVEMDEETKERLALLGYKEE